MWTARNPLHTLLFAFLTSGMAPTIADMKAAEEKESVQAFEIMEHLDKAGYSASLLSGFLENRATMLRAYAYVVLYSEQPHDQGAEARLAYLSQGLPQILGQALRHVVGWLHG